MRNNTVLDSFTKASFAVVIPRLITFCSGHAWPLKPFKSLAANYFWNRSGKSTLNAILREFMIGDREKCPIQQETWLFCEYLAKRKAPINLEPKCGWTGMGGTLQWLCSREFAVPLREIEGVEKTTTALARLFDINTTISKFEIVLCRLICLFGMDENLKNRRWVVCNLIGWLKVINSLMCFLFCPLYV